MHNRIRLFLLAHEKEQAKRWVSKKDTCLRRDACSFWRSKKEQAIDEYYRQVGGGWLFLWRNVKNDRFSLHISENFSIFAVAKVNQGPFAAD